VTLTNGVEKFSSDVARGDWASALSTYQGLVSIGEQAIANAQKNSNYSNMSATQTLAVGPYGNNGGTVYPTLSGGFDWKTIGLVAGVGLLAFFMMRD
jgi:hypothetical protein